MPRPFHRLRATLPAALVLLGVGADSVADEPMHATEYWKKVEEIGRHSQTYEPMQGGMERWFDAARWVMRHLRDHTTMVGGANYSGNQMNLFVSRASPHYQRLVTTLTRELDIPAHQLR